MAQLNINITEEFARDLQSMMTSRGLSNKSEAVRIAVKEAAEKAKALDSFDYRRWLGIGLRAPLNVSPRISKRG